jgi:hypothetical protein
MASSSEAQKRTRIFIDWTASDGEINTLSLETLATGLGKAKEKALESLLLEIQNELSQTAERPISPVWPPAVRLERLRANRVRLGKADWKWILTYSLGATAVACTVLYLALVAASVVPALRLLLLQENVGLFITGFLLLFVLGRLRMRRSVPPPLPAPLLDQQDRQE